VVAVELQLELNIQTHMTQKPLLWWLWWWQQVMVMVMATTKTAGTAKWTAAAVGLTHQWAT
jgi:hypothetical protein